MSCGPTDMHREEEKKAAGMVEKCCRNCDYRKCNMGSLCLPCSNNSNFTPSRAAIFVKLEELRAQEKEGEVSKGNLMDEAIEYFENLSSLPVLMNPAYPNRIERMAKKCQRYKDISDFLKSLKSERAEMMAVLKNLIEWRENYLTQHIDRIDEICEQAKEIIKKAEGK